jgi:F-type H+-transporting ATPase subunit b
MGPLLAAAAAASDGQPTASLLTINGTLVFEIVVFLLMLGVLWRWVYPRVMEMAERRERALEAGLQNAQEAERQLSKVRGEVERILDDARAEARELVSQAQRRASAEAEAVRAQARKEADALLEAARAEVGAERDRALRRLRAHEASLVVAAAGRVLGDAIDAEAHRDLIERLLAGTRS